MHACRNLSSTSPPPYPPASTLRPHLASVRTANALRHASTILDHPPPATTNLRRRSGGPCRTRANRRANRCGDAFRTCCRGERHKQRLSVRSVGRCRRTAKSHGRAIPSTRQLCSKPLHGIRRSAQCAPRRPSGGIGASPGRSLLPAYACVACNFMHVRRMCVRWAQSRVGAWAAPLRFYPSAVAVVSTR